MNVDHLSAQADRYLNHFCLEIPGRRTGSPGNRQAVADFAKTISAFGFQVETPEFECLDWINSGADLEISGQQWPVQPSPYTPGCQALGPLATIETVEELENADLSGKIALLRGEIAREQLMPKNFPFYNPDEHQRIYRAVEDARPLAILTATAWSPETAGAVYPCPMFEDGDFDIPSAFISESSGARLATHAGQTARLKIKAERFQSRGSNVYAGKNLSAGRRVFVVAHIDAKEGSPGALDNATGVCTLLLLAELLKDYRGSPGVEIVAINGEDDYSAAGEIDLLERRRENLGDTILAINMDGLGYQGDAASWSLYECPPEIAGLVEQTFARHGDFAPGQPWYQGDHMVFAMNGTPALALTSERLREILYEIAHTEKDVPALASPLRLAKVALALADLIQALDRLHR